MNWCQTNVKQFSPKLIKIINLKYSLQFASVLDDLPSFFLCLFTLTLFQIKSIKPRNCMRKIVEKKMP